jgi:transposase-like protein
MKFNEVRPVIIDRKQFSAEKYQEMVQKRMNGERIVDIAQDNGISRKSLNDKFDQQKIKVLHEKPRENRIIDGKSFSVNQINEITKMRQSGQTIPDIARIQGISKVALTHFFKMNEISIIKDANCTYIGKKPYNAIQTDNILSRYRTGESMASIAKLFDVHISTLRRFLVSQGAITSDEKVNAHTKPSKKIDGDLIRIGVERKSKVDVCQMVEARKKGDPIKDIALKFGVNENSLNNYLRKYRITPQYPDGTVRFGNKAFSSQQMETIIKRRLDGETIQILSKELGIHYETLGIFFQKRCIQPINEVLREINRKYNIDHDFFKRIDSGKKAYLLGLIMTDGNIHKKHNSLRLEFQKRDKELCEIARSSLSPQTIITERASFRKSGPMVRVQFNSKTLCEDLSQLGVKPSTKTYYNKFPDESVLPRQFQPDYIRGVIDGDGSVIISNHKGVTKDYKQFAVSLSGTFDMVKGVQDVLIQNVGLSETKLVYDVRTRNNYSMRYGGIKNLSKIFEYLYPSGFNPVGNCLQRKYNRMKSVWDLSRSHGI